MPVEYNHALKRIIQKDKLLQQLRARFTELLDEAQANHSCTIRKITEYTDIFGEFNALDINREDVPFVYKRIKKIQQKIHRTTQQRKRLMIEARRADTREKIQLGGLVVKANLRDCDKALVLGALKNCLTQLHPATKRVSIRLNRLG